MARVAQEAPQPQAGPAELAREKRPVELDVVRDDDPVETAGDLRSDIFEARRGTARGRS